MPLPWAPKSLLADTDDWSFTNDANRAMSDLATMGEKLMQPVGRQVRSVVEQALPAPNLPQTPTNIGQTPTNIAQQAPALPRFSLGTVEDWLTPAPAPQPAPQLQQPAPPTMPATAPAAKAGMFSLPSLESFLGPGSGAATTSGPATAAASASPSGPGPVGAAPAAGGDLREYARAVAGRYGLDPGIFERQITQESGFDPKAVSPAGAQGIAQFMPATAKGVGLADPFEPYAALDAAARHMRDNLAANGGDYARALAAYNAGQGAVNQHGGVPPFAETRKYVQAILGADRPTAPAMPAPTGAAVPKPTQGPAYGTYTPESLTPNQITEGAAQGLSASQALAICGPAAAVAFARANGRNPTLREAKELAEATGVWDEGAGMHGPASQVQLLEKMGVPSRLEQGADWAAIANEVRAGRPVIVDTPQHYFTVTAAHPDGTFEFGQSAGVLKASKGRTRYRPEEIPNLGMGAPRATIFMRPGGR